ncbi:hypothetical protein [Collinsella sp. AM13-34]|uniref:hypothetical protein n=1 Tax=Collinsella sp. AM13-34 TaxID=2292024 RepID=UPI000E52CDD2|nr:hypothetical protein [Collinsella sp. AM13-34]RHI84880.1 hypothetical protein DW151_06445 [Collinsella sp. AM13-34]
MSGPKAEVLQSNKVVEPRLEAWRNNLLGLMKKQGLTQNDLKDLINDRFYGESEKPRFTQKNVSTWVNAGLPDRKGHVRPFPKFEIMLQIAAVLEVDLGYLIGDIECKTYKAQDAHEYTGIEESALEEVRKITHFERRYHLGESRGSNSAMISEILKSPILPELLDEMACLIRLNDKRDDITEAVVAEYGEELVNRAFRFRDDFVAPGPDAPEEELHEVEAINEAVFESAGVSPVERPRFMEAVKAINKAIDDCYDEENRLVRDESASRYMVQKRFGEIVELIAPSRFTK